MRHLLTAALLLWAAPLAAQEFTTDAAKAAQAAYEADLQAAKEKYAKALAAALTQAATDGQTEELGRIADAIKQIDEPDPLEKARAIIMSKTYESSGSGKKIQTRFLPDGTTWSKQGGKETVGGSVWQMLEKDTLLTKGQGVTDNYFVWQFYDDYDRYRSIRLIYDAKVLSREKTHEGGGVAVK